jgi:hypothetical protein
VFWGYFSSIDLPFPKWKRPKREMPHVTCVTGVIQT